ncbi:MAG: tetratricopeptide repeat protein, partial [Bradyrhizobiaceae bacterium]|nr:tetratricopeptide repeat protein [Bradyrhizobiaceae bacterium]
MSDIFTEVDEEVRREELARLWKRYGNYVYAVVCLLVAAVAAWVAYNRWLDSKADAAGAAFDAAARLIEEGKSGEAEAAFAKVAAEGTPGYQALAQLRLANAIAARDPAAAVADYDKIAGTMAGQPLFSELASVRAATLRVDTASYDEMSRRLEPLTVCEPANAGWSRWLFSLLGAGKSDGCRAFRHTARE